MTESAHAPMVPGLTGLTVMAYGGYATVYRAVQESVGREVAVKIENRMFDNERDRRRFLREARAAGRMSSHPHVVDLFDAGVTTTGYPYLIMELCQGSYADRMKISPLPAAEVCNIGVKIADALADSHALGVLHRDVKPANILHSCFGDPKLADFGLAVLTEARDHSVTLDVLTPAYAPPEMFRHAPPAPPADVYALCATLYALMRGRPPRWHDDRNPSLVSLVDMFDEPIPDLPGVAPEVIDVLRRGMANDETARPSAVELRDALGALRLPAAHGQGPPGRTVASGFGGSDPAASEGEKPPPAGPSLVKSSGVSGSGPGDWPGSGSGPGGGPGPVTGGVSGPGAGSVRRPLLVAGAVVTALAVLIAGLTWYGLTHRVPSAGPLAQQSAVPVASSAAPSSTGSPGGCALAVTVPGVRCVTTAECYGALSVSDGGVATASKLDCARAHRWEVFAYIDLPAGVTSADYRTVKDLPSVREACSHFTLTQLSFDVAVAWQVDVLPPAPERLRAGDRTVRCLAGQSTGATSTGSKFGRPG